MSSAYRDAGVDIAAANRAKELMAAAVRSTHGPAVLAGMGAFGGCFDAGVVATLQEPILVASTDGVGTKTLIAAALGRYDTIGQDLVHHCINDILVQGARPLFFLDYIAAAHLEPNQVAAIVGGVASACRTYGCALLGGETAEMPDVYAADAFDLAGTIIGVVDRNSMLPTATIGVGDVILALPSSGLHTNGYSLARRLAASGGYAQRPELLGGTSVGEALLAVHRCYLTEVEQLRAAVPVKGLAHITGGGVFDNLPRILPEALGAEIIRGSWSIPPIFDYLIGMGRIEETEAYHAFNMGLGMLVVVAADSVDSACRTVPEAVPVGRISTDAGVRLV
jgi:phosphoribosylformylglycinamidine cyclo-ligase